MHLSHSSDNSVCPGGSPIDLSRSVLFVRYDAALEQQLDEHESIKGALLGPVVSGVKSRNRAVLLCLQCGSGSSAVSGAESERKKARQQKSLTLQMHAMQFSSDTEMATWSSNSANTNNDNIAPSLPVLSVCVRTGTATALDSCCVTRSAKFREGDDWIRLVLVQRQKKPKQEQQQQQQQQQIAASPPSVSQDASEDSNEYIVISRQSNPLGLSEDHVFFCETTHTDTLCMASWRIGKHEIRKLFCMQKQRGCPDCKRCSLVSMDKTDIVYQVVTEAPSSMTLDDIIRHDGGTPGGGSSGDFSEQPPSPFSLSGSPDNEIDESFLSMQFGGSYLSTSTESDEDEKNGRDALVDSAEGRRKSSCLNIDTEEDEDRVSVFANEADEPGLKDADDEHAKLEEEVRPLRPLRPVQFDLGAQFGLGKSTSLNVIFARLAFILFRKISFFELNELWNVTDEEKQGSCRLAVHGKAGAGKNILRENALEWRKLCNEKFQAFECMRSLQDVFPEPSSGQGMESLISLWYVRGEESQNASQYLTIDLNGWFLSNARASVGLSDPVERGACQTLDIGTHGSAQQRNQALGRFDGAGEDLETRSLSAWDCREFAVARIRSQDSDFSDMKICFLFRNGLRNIDSAAEFLLLW